MTCCWLPCPATVCLSVCLSACLLTDSALQSLANKKKGITDEDLLALVGDEVHQAAVVWELVDLQVGRHSTHREGLAGRPPSI